MNIPEHTDGELSDAANIDVPAMARGINEQNETIKVLRKDVAALEKLLNQTETRLQSYIEGFETQAELTRNWREKYQALAIDELDS